MKKCELLQQKAREERLPPYMYQPYHEPLMPKSAWEVLPSHYEAHVKEKNAKVRALMREMSQCESFVFFADAHVRQNSMASVPIIRSILENTEVKKVIYGGDTVSAWVDEQLIEEDLAYFANAYSFAKPYVVRGNHDAAGKMLEYTDEGCCKSNDEIYRLIFAAQKDRVIGEEGKTYYYFDAPEHRLRYIILDTNELLTPYVDEHGVWQCAVDISKTQVEWFARQLGAIPADYQAIVIGHTPIYPQLKWCFPKAVVFSRLIEAYHKRETFCIHSEENGFDVDVDFSGVEGGNVILNLCGHGHVDDLFLSPTGCAACEIHTDSVRNNNGGSPDPRVAGTVSDSLLDVILIDRTTGRIRSVRYGAGNDRIIREAIE